MDEQQSQNPSGLIMLAMGLGSAVVCFILRLPNVLLWGVLIPLPLIIFGWHLGRTQVRYPKSLLLGLILGIGLVGANIWLISKNPSTSTTNSSNTQRTPSQADTPETTSSGVAHEIIEFEGQLKGWKSSSRTDESGNHVLSKKVELHDFSVWQDHYKGQVSFDINNLDTEIHYRDGKTVIFRCSSPRDKLGCQNTESIEGVKAKAIDPYLISITGSDPATGAFSSHCLFKSNKKAASACDAVHQANFAEEALLVSYTSSSVSGVTALSREDLRDWGFSMEIPSSFLGASISESMLSLEMVQVNFYLDKNDQHQIHAVRYNLHSPTSSFNEIICQRDNRNQVACSSSNTENPETIKARLVNQYVLGATSKYDGGFASYCIYKKSEFSRSDCRGVHSDNFNADNFVVAPPINPPTPETPITSAEPAVPVTTPEATPEISEVTTDTIVDEEELVIDYDFDPSSLSQITLGSHELRVSYLDYSPDGKYLASASEDKTIKLWDTTQKQVVRVFNGHQAWVNSISFSPDSKLLASGADDKSVRVWDVETGEELYSLMGHSQGVFSVDFHPEKDFLVSADGAGVIKIWNLDTRSEEKTLGDIGGYARASFHPYGGKVFGGFGNGDLAFWSWQYDNRWEPEIFTGHTDGVLLMAFDPKGDKVASVSRDTTVRVWDIEDEVELWVNEAHTEKAIAVAFHPSGNVLATGGSDNLIKIWDAYTGELIQTLTGHEERVLALDFSADGMELASGSFDNTIKLWHNLSLPDFYGWYASEQVNELTPAQLNQRVQILKLDTWRDGNEYKIRDLQVRIGPVWEFSCQENDGKLDCDGGFTERAHWSPTDVQARMVGPHMISVTHRGFFQALNSTCFYKANRYRFSSCNEVHDQRFGVLRSDEVRSYSGKELADWKLGQVLYSESSTEFIAVDNVELSKLDTYPSSHKNSSEPKVKNLVVTANVSDESSTIGFSCSRDENQLLVCQMDSPNERGNDAFQKVYMPNPYVVVIKHYSDVYCFYKADEIELAVCEEITKNEFPTIW